MGLGILFGALGVLVTEIVLFTAVVLYKINKEK